MSERGFQIGVNTIITRDGKLLLGLRKNCYGEGTWALPGGHLEIGEDMKKGAARELFEETGIVPENIEFANIVNNPAKDGRSHYVQVGFLVNKFKGEPELKEPNRCGEWRWFETGNLPKEIFLNHQKQIEIFLSGEEKYVEG